MSPSPRAACLTPPAIGGIAVVQVVGQEAIPLVNRCLRKGSRPVDLSAWSDRELRLCRVVDGGEPIDDAIVAVRRTDTGGAVVDLGLHGGARIVQRVLLLLQRAGARIVEPAALLETAWPAATRLHADANRLMLRAQTRRVALWLARLPDVLADRIEAIVSQASRGQTGQAVAALDRLLAGTGRARLLVAGVRAVLLGPPNSGKSTLANTLAEREHAVVSDLPGTTRDWTEHPAAVEGVPFTIVDTAGIRPTDDPVEAEAIRRARDQIFRAAVLIRVIDGSQPPDRGNEELSAASAGPAGEQTPILVVYNKADLPAHPGHEPPADAIAVSARTGDGIDALRARLLATVRLADEADWPVAPFTAEQAEALQRAREDLAGSPPDRTSAIDRLQNLSSQGLSDGQASDSQV